MTKLQAHNSEFEKILTKKENKSGLNCVNFSTCFAKGCSKQGQKVDQVSVIRYFLNLENTSKSP